MSVTVIIPAFNSASTLERATSSVLRAASSYSTRIVVIDDHSTDDTLALATDLHRTHPESVLAISNHRKKGASGARNTGLEFAEGDYVAFLDADDVWLPNHLQTLIGSLERDPRIDAVFANSEICCASNEAHEGYWFDSRLAFRSSSQDARHLDDVLNDPVSTLLQDSFLHLQSLVVRRFAVQRIHFDEDLTRSEDRDFGIQLLTSGFKLAVTNAVTSIYYRHPGSLTAGDMSSQILTLEARRNLYARYLGELPRYGSVLRGQLLDTQSQLAYCHRTKGDPRKAMSECARGMKFGMSGALVLEMMKICASVALRTSASHNKR